MTRYVTLQDARQMLADLVAAAGEGEEFTITDSGKPIARLAPIETRNSESGPRGIRHQIVPPEFAAADARVAEMLEAGTVPSAMRKLPSR